ncbi:TonB-dependent receptor domain-containing protein [Sphingomonas sp.]|uniref:TonB-dependent receptor domain-containing protein n=1 Tax=Sphingomonas sp. TaxID=28214 RepID=UPI002BE2C582|nr:TonB-dependent receptor [Sphingomonas sp.]HTG37890.1 TonB-dependent receptor [Sphingomonas sp.]
MRTTRWMSATALAGVVAVLPTAAFGQAAVPPEVAQEEQVAEGQAAPADQAIVVTGTRIRQPNLESVVPITSVSGEEFFETGQVSVGDILNDLPQLANNFSQQNSTRFLGTRGISLLDLRNLGTQRTLVLVNGRRHVAGDILVNGVSPDINTIPTDLIERVDITTGGSSSVYGSDAIAGVVNFVLKDNFEGIQLRGQAGVNLDYGDAGNQYVSALVGKNFAEGRGNVALNVEYSHQSDYYGSGRPAFRTPQGLLVTDSDTGANFDNTPDRTFFRDFRSSTISLGGQVAFASPTGACGRDSLGAAFSCGYIFNPDGSLVAQTGQRVGLAPNGNYIGGNGNTNREGQLLALSPDLERISINTIGHFEVTPALVPFFEAKYSRSTAFGSQSGPFFSQGGTLGAGAREQIRFDNPYLSDQARGVLTAARIASGADAPVGDTRFALRKNWVEFGARDEEITRETFRIVGGIRGDFNDDWNYEISANYGEHNETNQIAGNVNIQRYLLGLDSARNAAGQIVCRSQIDPTAAVAYVDNPATLAADVAACVPINPFGQGASSQAARDYVIIDSLATGKITQFVGSAFMSGDLSQLFELPGGPIAFSVGAEYRRETNYYDLDDLTQAGYAFYNAIPEFTAPAFEVKEVFGEVSIPLLKDLPFAHALTVTGSGRLADYNNAVGTVFAWSAGVDYAPIPDIRFRGSYSRSIRSPNLSELYSAQSQNFAPGFTDPCSARNIGTGSNTRAANCAAAGRPAGYDYVYTSSLEILSGGNPDLREETGTSYTIGGIFEPTFFPGFSISVDYYDVAIENVITSVDAQDIANQCYDLATLDNQFCDLIERAGPGGGPNGEEAFRILEGSLLASTLNFAKLKARGIDTNVSYRHNLGWGNLLLSGIWTRTLQRDDFVNPTDPDRIDRILYQLGNPRDQVNFNARLGVGDVRFGYELRWISKQYLNTYEDFNSLQGRPAENPDYAPFQFYPEVFYHNIRADVDVNDKFNLYAGIDNVGNELPPLGLTGVGAGSGIYDVRGRYGYLGFVAKF